MTSTWRDERNARSRLRLERSLPALFPGGVLAHALARPLIPPTPRRAVESYWRLHPMRADRLARALATRSGQPADWVWRTGTATEGLATTFRLPPAPYREKAFARGPGHCCVCGQPVYRYGWHVDLWQDARPNRNASWHACCVVAWKLWTAPSTFDKSLKRRQKRRCAETGKRLFRTAEVDHRVPLFRVWQEHRHKRWQDLLAFWGGPNLQVINRAAHVAKCVGEGKERAAGRRARRPDDPAGAIT